jgi:hypothetical protein
MTRDEQIETITRIELARYGRPRCQEDCCAVAARVDVWLLGVPRSDAERLTRALGMAKGLFGPAYEEADEGQRWQWIDMCERALRDVEETRRVFSP